MAKFFGTPGRDVYKGTRGKDWISGGAEADVLAGGRGRDVLDGGAGSDWLDGGAGKDRLVYRLAENSGATDVYRGGRGRDTLRLELTGAEWRDEQVQQQVRLLKEHLDAARQGGKGGRGDESRPDFTLRFGNDTTLHVSSIERLEVQVDGRGVGLLLGPWHSPGAEHSLIATNPAQPISGRLGARDAEVGGGLKFKLADAPSHGSLELACDGSYTYRPAPGYSGTDRFTFTVSDERGGTSVGHASIEVAGCSSLQVEPASGTRVGEGQVHQVVALAGGGHLLVFSSPGDGEGTFVQRYDADGTKVGGRQALYTGSDGSGTVSSVAALGGGGYVASWTSQVEGGWEAYVQRYADDGSRLGSEVRLNPPGSGEAVAMSTAALADGGYAATWNRFDFADGSQQLWARLFNADGSARGEAVALLDLPGSGGPVSHLALVSVLVAGLDAGRFVAVWTLREGEETGVWARVYEADGHPVGSGPVQVVPTHGGVPGNLGVAALEGGGFAVSWMAWEDDGGRLDYFAQRFDADGALAGEVLQVSHRSYAEPHGLSKILALCDGGFVVLWYGVGPAGGGSPELLGQRYDASGARMGNEFLVQRMGGSSPDDMPVAAELRADGALVLAWSETHDDEAQSGMRQTILHRFETSPEAKKLVGGAGPDSFIGSAVGDWLRGAGGDDRLDGWRGEDRLSGGEGGDTFVFSTPPGAGQVDLLEDFVPGEDRLELVGGSGPFAALSPGELGAQALWIRGGGGEASPDTRLEYDPATGALFYDPDGTGEAAAVQFAVLATRPATLSAGDFGIVGS